MALIYRPAQFDELERAQALVVSSINDLTQRHGFGPMASVPPPHFQAFSLRDDPDGLWTAEENGELLGTALSWACGDLWFLAELFVSREHQGRGIGNELLKRTLQHARKDACRGQRRPADFGFRVGCGERRPQRGRAAWHAHRVSHAADVIAGVRRLALVFASQSRIHVMAMHERI